MRSDALSYAIPVGPAHGASGDDALPAVLRAVRIDPVTMLRAE